MTSIFRSTDTATTSIDLGEVGVIQPGGKGGLVIDERVAGLMAELQNNVGEPLTGKDLRAAAKTFADARGLTVVDVKQAEADDIHIANGDVPGPKIEDLARIDRQVVYNDDFLYSLTTDLATGEPVKAAAPGSNFLTEAEASVPSGGDKS